MSEFNWRITAVGAEASTENDKYIICVAEREPFAPIGSPMAAGYLVDVNGEYVKDGDDDKVFFSMDEAKTAGENLLKEIMFKESK